MTNPATVFAHRRSCETFRSWLGAWWDAAPWRIAPRDALERCSMGGCVDDSVWCRRRAVVVDGTALFCRRHRV